MNEKKKYHFIPFNILWCVGNFIIPFFLLWNNPDQIVIASICYIYGLDQACTTDLLEYKIEQLKDKK